MNRSRPKKNNLNKSKVKKSKSKVKTRKSRSPTPNLEKGNREEKSTIMLNNFNHSRNVYNNYFINVKQQSNASGTPNINHYLKLLENVEGGVLNDEPESNSFLTCLILNNIHFIILSIFTIQK